MAIPSPKPLKLSYDSNRDIIGSISEKHIRADWIELFSWQVKHTLDWSEQIALLQQGTNTCFERDTVR